MRKQNFSFILELLCDTKTIYNNAIVDVIR